MSQENCVFNFLLFVDIFNENFQMKNKKEISYILTFQAVFKIKI